MAYVHSNFKTKKALKDALATGQPVTVFEPGFGSVPENGKVSIEGPHYPRPHTRYATGTTLSGRLVKVS